MSVVRKGVSRLIGHPARDMIAGTNITATLKLLRESQRWNMERMNSYRLAKLRKLIAHAKQHVPYYRRLFAEIDFSHEDVKSLDDIKNIPILTKEAARAAGETLVSETINPRRVRKGKTGGSTGSPLVTYKDADDRSFTWASYYRWYEWMGLDRNAPVATLWGARTVTKKRRLGDTFDRTAEFLQNNLVINSFTMDEKTKPKIYAALKRFQPVLLKGYLSSLLTVAQFMRDNQLPPPSSLKALSSTSETLLPGHRAELEAAFKVPLFNQYGCGEVSGIAYECAAHHGMHITREHVILEVLDERGNDTIDTPGRVVATGLDNHAMPFIRYENGDLATMSGRPCDCGLNSPLITSIDGRSADTVILANGVGAHGVFFTDILFELGISVRQVSRFQARQKRPGEITLNLETPEPLTEAVMESIHSQLARFFSSATINQTPHIPAGENGKFRYILSD